MAKAYYIPLELTNNTIITEEYENCKVCWSKIGNRKVKSILIPSTKEQYYEYMRYEWRENKRQQRHGGNEQSIDRICDVYEVELKDDFDLEDSVMRKLLSYALREEMLKLSDKDRKILIMSSEGISEKSIGEAVGLSPKGVNKRKNSLFTILREGLNRANI